MRRIRKGHERRAAGAVPLFLALATAVACADPATAPAAAGEPVEARARPPRISMLDLGAHGLVYAVSRNGIVAGATTETGPAFPAVWRRGTLTALDLLPGSVYGVARDANPRGTVVGWVQFLPRTTAAVTWEDGVPTPLPSLPGGEAAPWGGSAATAVNAAGDVVGWSQGRHPESGLSQQATLWRRGTPTSLDPLAPSTQEVQVSEATAINERGQVVGVTNSLSGSGTRAFLWSDGVLTDLGTLGGGDSRANDVNERAQVVGWSRTAASLERAFIWERGVMTALPMSAAASTSRAYAINNRGQVVGEIGGRAVLWDDGRIVELGPPGSAALDVNEAGMIVGTARDATGRSRWVMWTLR